MNIEDNNSQVWQVKDIIGDILQERGYLYESEKKVDAVFANIQKMADSLGKKM
jgi:hypothetical protein